MGLKSQCIKQEKALKYIDNIIADWNAGRLCVVIHDGIYVRSDVPIISLDDLIATIRNQALSARNENELVLGIQEQMFPLVLESDSNLIPLDDIEFGFGELEGN